MSFSSQVKADLCEKKRSGCPGCTYSELYAILLFCARVGPCSMRITSESPDFIERCKVLIEKAAKADDICVTGSDRHKKNPTYTLVVRDADRVARILDRMPASLRSSVTLRIDVDYLKKPCCKKAFLKGAFLAAGTMSDPQKSYHLEISTPYYRLGGDLARLMEGCGLFPKEAKRKSSYVIYLKDSEGIEDFLNITGATASAFRFMEAKLLRDVRNNVNRVVNCETANIGKTVNAAERQRRAIELLDKRMGLSNLPEGLYQVARARFDNPDMPLAELCTKIEPPLSRSGLHHRLSRLVAMAESLDKENKLK